MMRMRIVSPVILILVVVTPAAQCFMQFIGPESPMPVVGGWPEPLKELVRGESRVVGMSGPIVDSWLACAGDTAELNETVVLCTQVPDAEFNVVLHPGSTTVSMPVSSGEKVTYDVNWRLRITEIYSFNSEIVVREGTKFKIQLDIWLAAPIELDELEIPASVEVRSSGEIERFVAAHEAKRKQDEKP